jgi:hypothetical protein
MYMFTNISEECALCIFGVGDRSKCGRKLQDIGVEALSKSTGEGEGRKNLMPLKAPD